MSRRVLTLVILLLAACARRQAPEGEVPDLLGEQDPAQMFPDLDRQTMSMFLNAISKAEHTHTSERREPCKVAWGHLEALIARGRETRFQSARFYEVCGCCFSPGED